MTDPIRTCEDHGAFSGDRCPVCGERSTRLLEGSKRRRLSKYLSGALDDVRTTGLQMRACRTFAGSTW